MRLKRLEQWWRRLWIRMLVGAMRRSADPRPDWASRPFRVLFLRHDRAGDMIVSTGIIRGIARSHPTITMDVLASPANSAIIETSDYVTNLVVFDKKRLSSYLPTLLCLRSAHYDAVIDCMVTAPSVTTLLLILASGARHRIGIAGRGNDAAFNLLVPVAASSDAHMVDRIADLAQAFDVVLDTAARHPILEISDDERARAEMLWGASPGIRRILINVSAGTSDRVWPDDNYIAIMRRLHEQEPAAVLRVIAAPAESERGARIARAGGGAFVPTPNIRDAFALVATADFVLTPDTSIAHAASAFHRPSVALYTRGKAERWGLYGTIGRNIEHSELTLATLSVDRVSEAIDSVLASSLATRG
ncbi:MAG TPA: glycosyltransferase family 9 protein [Gemmatimonadaceae bacterium]